MYKKIIVTIYNDEEFEDALAEIKSSLDYDDIDYNIVTEQ
jgi:hypothetical protein